MVKSQQMTYQIGQILTYDKPERVCPKEMALRCWFHQIHFLDSGLVARQDLTNFDESSSRIWPFSVSFLPIFGRS
jgi:hypothetical protein